MEKTQRGLTWLLVAIICWIAIGFMVSAHADSLHPTTPTTSTVNNDIYQKQESNNYNDQYQKQESNNYNDNYIKNTVDVNNKNIATGGAAYAGALSQGSKASSNNGGVAVSQNYQQIRQAPMAWSPGLAMSASQENCNNSVSLGVSAGFGAISGGAPVSDDECNRRRDAILWMNVGQARIACERMAQDEDNAKAMKAAGVSCATITATSYIRPASYTPSPLAQETEQILNGLKHY